MFAKGLVRLEAARSSEWVGRHSDELADDLAPEVVHRDDLVVL
jgi:glutamate 5-kinase